MISLLNRNVDKLDGTIQCSDGNFLGSDQAIDIPLLCNKILFRSSFMIYQPSFISIKAHPLPDWYNDVKLGIFINWGVSSVPADAPKGH
jgi:hypothetical protein